MFRERGAARSGAPHPPAFTDRTDAGRALAAALADEAVPPAVVVGLARGGVVVAAEVAAATGLPLDAVAVRKVGHPLDPEYALGATTPEGGAFLRGHDGLSDEELGRVVARAQARAAELDRVLHGARPPVPIEGVTCILVDDGLATGATMVAAVRWARHRGAGRVVAAVPVAPVDTAAALRREADRVVAVHEVADLWAVGLWYRRFPQVEDDEVLRLLAGAAGPGAGGAP